MFETDGKNLLILIGKNLVTRTSHREFIQYSNCGSTSHLRRFRNIFRMFQKVIKCNSGFIRLFCNSFGAKHIQIYTGCSEMLKRAVFVIVMYSALLCSNSSCLWFGSTTGMFKFFLFTIILSAQHLPLVFSFFHVVVPLRDKEESPVS